MLTIEIFKSLKYSDLMNDVFQVKSPVPYYLRDKNEFYSRNPKTVTYRTDSISYERKNPFPQEWKNYQSLYSFKESIRK